LPNIANIDPIGPLDGPQDEQWSVCAAIMVDW